MGVWDGWHSISPKGTLLPRTASAKDPDLSLSFSLLPNSSFLAVSSSPFLCCTTGFTSQADAISGIFALTLLARDRQGLGSRSGCSSLTMVMNPDSVCSSSLVLHRDSGWDCRTKARRNSDPGAQHCKGGSRPPCETFWTCPEVQDPHLLGVTITLLHPMALSEPVRP